jgi:hypothetical protein
MCERVGGVSHVRNVVLCVLLCGGERYEWVYIGGAPKLTVWDFLCETSWTYMRPLLNWSQTPVELALRPVELVWTSTKPSSKNLVWLESNRPKSVEPPLVPVQPPGMSAWQTICQSESELSSDPDTGWTCPYGQFNWFKEKTSRTSPRAGSTGFDQRVSQFKSSWTILKTRSTQFKSSWTILKTSSTQLKSSWTVLKISSTVFELEGSLFPKPHSSWTHIVSKRFCFRNSFWILEAWAFKNTNLFLDPLDSTMIPILKLNKI